MHPGASGVRRGNHAIVRVEEVSLMPTLISTLSPILRAHNHYRHPVAHHRIHHHIKDGVGERICQSLPVSWAFTRDPPLVRRLRLIPCRLAGASDHAECLPDISPQAHPIKQADQGVECTLEPAGSDEAPCHRPCRGQPDAYPNLHALPDPPRPQSLPSPSCAPPHPPPH